MEDMKILFVCHGNICRSPMAEYVMKDMLAKAGLCGVTVESAALHTDELGNDIHSGTRRELTKHGIPFAPRRAWLLSSGKLREYDLVVGMDAANMRDLRRLAGPADAHKLRRLLDFAGVDRDVADPWYTGDFEATYADIVAGCSALLDALRRRLAEPPLAPAVLT
ncbi:MAG: low molecular weight phosphotyrosine protein phosphatase [Kiritimatiellae bacterium]|nr:low molecular weight phosphotyrosine protein phosphatase [Kiritimatiellia bacterium]